jgi:hypothetical protein
MTQVAVHTDAHPAKRKPQVAAPGHVLPRSVRWLDWALVAELEVKEGPSVQLQAIKGMCVRTLDCMLCVPVLALCSCVSHVCMCVCQ